MPVRSQGLVAKGGKCKCGHDAAVCTCPGNPRAAAAAAVSHAVVTQPATAAAARSLHSCGCCCCTIIVHKLLLLLLLAHLLRESQGCGDGGDLAACQGIPLVLFRLEQLIQAAPPGDGCYWWRAEGGQDGAGGDICAGICCCWCCGAAGGSGGSFLHLCCAAGVQAGEPGACRVAAGSGCGRVQRRGYC